MASEPIPPQVYFVPTPIGNRNDFTLRAIEVLQLVDFICCEDTRHSSPLLQHHGIHKPLISLHEHNEVGRSVDLVAKALAGETFAVISDAGMPGVSDPGYRLIQALRHAEIPFTVLPGPSAVLTALIGSGFPSDAFFFGGFLPIKKGKRRKVLAEAVSAVHTSLFFESPHRIAGTLELLTEIDSATPTCVARELTKKFETYHRNTASELAQHFKSHSAKGEIVLIIGGINYPRHYAD